MGKLNFISIALLSMCMGFIACENEMEILSERIPIHISFTPQTRATDDAFEEGDKIGLYVSNYNNGVPSTLMTTGNHVDNAMFVYEDSKWLPENNIYWKDKNTAADFYAYYPYSASVNISAHPFFVQADQSTEDAFWASDFLWGKATNVTPTPSSVAIQTNHSLSSILVDIKPGSGFTAASWAAAEKSVKICEVKTAATINLSTGVATATGNGGEIIPLYAAETGTTISYKAMMIPQVVADNSRLVVVTVDGTEYVYRKGYTFTPNTQHKFIVTVNKSGSSVDVTIGEWEIDSTTNEGDAEEENESEANIIPNNQIWYTATTKVEPSASADFGAMIKSNEWDSTTGKGIITFDGNITKIGDEAFYFSNLETITIPKSVTAIGGRVFKGCQKLTDVQLSENITKITYDAFNLCLNLENVEIPNSVVTIENRAFEGCSKLSCMVIPESVTAIYEDAFKNCSKLNSVTIGCNVATIGNNAFYNCESLTNLTIPNSVTAIGDYAFYQCEKISNLTLGNSLTQIGAHAFQFCKSLTKVTIPNSVTKIAVYGFEFCENLSSVTLGSGLTTIESYAFYNCDKLSNIYCKAITPPVIDYHDILSSDVSGRKIYVPAESLTAYKNSTKWSVYADDIFADTTEN